MSKSLNNIIGLTDEPNEMFGKTMSIPDALIEEFISLTTDFSPQEKADLLFRMTEGENPMNIKKIIAKNIIAQYHNKTAADQAEQFFINQFQNKNFEEKEYEPIPISSLGIENKISVVELCHQLKNDLSKSAIRRLIENGGVQINNNKITDSNNELGLIPGTKIKIGKRGFLS
ncbi:S4 domain-containing protein [Chryseobacterium sp. 1B4]